MATDKVHMDQTRNNIKSTEQQEKMKLEDPLMKLLIQHTNTVFNKIINQKRKIYTDITGKFPVSSNRRKKYLLLLNV